MIIAEFGRGGGGGGYNSTSSICFSLARNIIVLIDFLKLAGFGSTLPSGKFKKKKFYL